MPRKTVLVVEDHADTREMYLEALTGAGLNTVGAATAEQALRRLAAMKLDVVVTDLRLGAGADGLELCERLKADPATKDIPVIILTGSTHDKRMHDRAAAVGCALLLLKPVDPFAIVAEIHRLVG